MILDDTRQIRSLLADHLRQQEALKLKAKAASPPAVLSPSVPRPGAYCGIMLVLKGGVDVELPSSSYVQKVSSCKESA